MMPEKDVKLTALFDDIIYNITVTNGTSSAPTAKYQEEVTVTANAPGVDEYFDKWEVTGLDTKGMDLTKTEIKFQMPAGDVTFKATYLTIEKFDIVVVDGTKDKEVAKAGEIVTGFYAGRTHAIIECEDCLLGVEENRVILDLVLEHMKEYHIRPYEELTGKGLVRHVMIRKGFATGAVMVCLIVNGDSLPHADALVERLRTIRGMESITLNINREQTNVIMGREIKLLWGQPYIEDTIGNVRFRISPLSFYQVNPLQTEKLYNKALEYAGLTGEETVWDLYCGIGTISLFLAQRAKQVYGVEIVPAAIEDAKANAALNGMTNAEFFVGKAEEVLPEKYEKEGITADVIVVDPPRKGCEESVLATMIQMAPKRIVYVSCDSATLARDLKYLCHHGYELTRCCPTDMFGNTVHVETVCLLSRKDK